MAAPLIHCRMNRSREPRTLLTFSLRLASSSSDRRMMIWLVLLRMDPLFSGVIGAVSPCQAVFAVAKTLFVGKITALYCRLSQEDMQGGESESIQDRNKLLTKYTKEHRFTNTRCYADDGYTGTNFARVR